MSKFEDFEKDLNTAAKDPSITNTNTNARKLVEAYAQYVKDQKGVDETKKFSEWLSVEGKTLTDKIAADTKAATTTGDDAAKTAAGAAAAKAAQEAATTYMNEKKLNGKIKAKVFTPEESSQLGDWLGKNWPMLAAIAAPIIALVTGMFGDNPLPALLLGAGAIGVATYAAKPDSVLGQGRDYLKKQLKIGQEPVRAPGVGTGVSAGRTEPTAAPVVDPAIALAEAQAQADFEKPNGTGTTITSAQKDNEVVITVASNKDPKIARTFKGTMAEDGTLTIDRITYTKDGKTQDATIPPAEQIKIDGLGVDDNGSGTQLVNEKLQASRNTLDTFVQGLGKDGKGNFGHGLPPGAKITTPSPVAAPAR